MWVERVALENFLAFKKASVEFAPGLNVVLSPNEGGKSSLFRGIAAGFYSSAASQKGEILALARWGSAERFRIEIEFRLGQVSYLLVRDFASREQTITRAGETKPFAKGKAVEEFLGGHLPLSDENLFLRVCGVRHEELAKICDGASGVGEAIEEILGGGWGSATPAGVQKTVEDKKKELLKGRDRPVNEANRGSLKRFMDEVERLESDAARASALSNARAGFLKTISDIDSKARLLDADLDLLRRKKEKSSAYRDLGKNEKAAREKADGLRKRKDRVAELSAKKQDLAAEGSRFPDELARGTPAFLDETRVDLERESSLEKERAAAGSRERKNALPWRLLLASALILTGAVGIVIGKPLMALFLVAGAGLIAWHLARRPGRGKAGAPAGLEGELDRLAKKRAVLLGGRSLDESKALLAECAAWRERTRDVESRIEEAVGGRGVDPLECLGALDRAYGDAALELRALEESRAKIEAFKTDGDGMLRLDRDIGAREEEGKRLAAARALADRGLAALERLDEIDIAERLACAKEGLERAGRRERVLEAILETLAEARREIAGFLAERLPPLAAAYVSRITGGRYETLFIDPLTLRVETVPARGDGDSSGGASSAPERIEPDSVSQGTRDQIHLALRLALVELMSRGEPQPIFLDDPFVHFDPARRERALDLVREFSARHQVVIFTCDPRYREAGGRLIELPSRA
ncbi:MAG: AAA family ATPase [Candidatus Krumholzibacteria bacterium]|nr:AAA family ATPase [Candidatus Krumholzibacteria bacterium]